MSEIQQLEELMLQAGVALICRDANGLMRIERIVQVIKEVGSEMISEPSLD